MDRRRVPKSHALLVDEINALDQPDKMLLSLRFEHSILDLDILARMLTLAGYPMTEAQAERQLNSALAQVMGELR